MELKECHTLLKPKEVEMRESRNEGEDQDQPLTLEEMKRCLF